MSIETWGEFENAIAATLKNYAIKFATNMAPNAANNESAIQSCTKGLFSGISQSIKTFYDQMGKNNLGEPNKKNIDKMLDIFWGELEKSREFKSITDNDMWDAATLQINKESFKQDFMDNITQYQTEIHKKNLKLADIACFRFAADGRTNETGYKNFNQASLENLGNLANLCCSLSVQGRDGGQLYTNASMESLRPAIMNELQNHANRQVQQEMNSEKVKVFLCGGFGKPEVRGDKGVGQVTPEHMWIELRYENGQTMSIDTFPNAAIRIAPNFEGAPSEPSRVHEAGKTVKVPLKGIPEGIVTALVSGKTTALRITNEKYAAAKENLTVYIAPDDGKLLSGDQAKQAFEQAYLFAGLDVVSDESDENLFAGLSVYS